MGPPSTFNQEENQRMPGLPAALVIRLIRIDSLELRRNARSFCFDGLRIEIDARTARTVDGRKSLPGRGRLPFESVGRR